MCYILSSYYIVLSLSRTLSISNKYFGPLKARDREILLYTEKVRWFFVNSSEPFSLIFRLTESTLTRLSVVKSLLHTVILLKRYQVLCCTRVQHCLIRDQDQVSSFKISWYKTYVNLEKDRNVKKVEFYMKQKEKLFLFFNWWKNYIQSPFH